MTLFAAVGSALASPVFFDGTFNNSDWSLATITNAGGAGSFVNAFQVPVGGNPTPYRIIRNSLSQGAPNSLVAGVHINVTAIYNPSITGVISSIDYSEDSINLLNQGGNGQGSGLAIFQGGSFYIQRNPVLVMPYVGFSSWTANPAPGLVAGDLWEIDFATGALNAFSNPDFSASGGPMNFGFWRGNSSGNQTSGVVQSECGIDNWRVEINPVPTPSAVALLGLGGLMAARRRRS